MINKMEKNLEKDKKLLVVICTYNPEDINYDETFEDFSHVWFDVIRSWQMQRSDDLHIDIVIADNVSGPKTRGKLIEFQKLEKDIYINFVDDTFSALWIPLNHTLSIFKHKENYDYYAFCASDAYFLNNGDLQILLNDMDENCCFISPQADNDMLQRYDFDVKKKPTRLCLNEAVNNHLAIMTKEFMEAYDYKWIDIIGGGAGGNEEFYTYQCAAIQRNELLSHKIMIHHIGKKDRKKVLDREVKPRTFLYNYYKRNFINMLDAGVKVGLGFYEISVNVSVYKNYFLNHPNLGPYYIIKYIILKYIVITNIFRNIFDVLSNLKLMPKKVSTVVEELQGKPYVHIHNPDFFDDNGYAKNDDLYHFIKENLFLTKDEFDYGKIRNELHYPPKK